MHQSICECESATCPTDSGYFYVSVRNDNGSYRLLLGPFAVHADALASVRIGEDLAARFDVKAHWYSYGTARSEQNIRPIFTACDNCGEISYHSHRTCACFGRRV